MTAKKFETCCLEHDATIAACARAVDGHVTQNNPSTDHHTSLYQRWSDFQPKLMYPVGLFSSLMPCHFLSVPFRQVCSKWSVRHYFFSEAKVLLKRSLVSYDKTVIFHWYTASMALLFNLYRNIIYGHVLGRVVQVARCHLRESIIQALILDVPIRYHHIKNVPAVVREKVHHSLPSTPLTDLQLC
jgi:hypothetical protein